MACLLLLAAVMAGILLARRPGLWAGAVPLALVPAATMIAIGPAGSAPALPLLTGAQSWALSTVALVGLATWLAADLATRPRPAAPVVPYLRVVV